MENDKIKNIIFDLGEVLLTGIRDTGLALAEKHKITDFSKNAVEWTNVKTPLLIAIVKEFLNGNTTEDEYLEQVISKYPEIGDKIFLKSHIRENFREIEGTREIILKLKGLEYRTALLSVHAKEWIDYCEDKFDFHKLFDVRAYSYEAGVSKPDTASFQHVLSKLEALPEECLFIDDSQLNIESAQKLGIKSILFKDARQLEKDLRTILPDFE